MNRQRVLVLHNEPVLPEDHPDYISEVEVMDNVFAVEEALRQAGFDVSTLGVASDVQELIDGVRGHRPDAVVNLFEGVASNNASELYAAGVLEWLGVPYTGCPFHTRCQSYIGDVCRDVQPSLTEVRPGHFAACHLYADPGSATPGPGAARPAGQLV